MGCFSFKLKRKGSKRKAKRAPEATKFGSGDDDGAFVLLGGGSPGPRRDSSGTPQPEVDGPRLGEAAPAQPPPSEVTDAAPEEAAVLRRGPREASHVSVTSSQVQRATREFLIQEIESLRIELEMRKDELHSLKKDYNELKDIADKLEAARRRTAELKARVEDLTEQLSLKEANERKLYLDLEDTRAALLGETRQKELLSLRLEEAEYKLSMMAGGDTRKVALVSS